MTRLAKKSGFPALFVAVLVLMGCSANLVGPGQEAPAIREAPNSVGILGQAEAPAIGPATKPGKAQGKDLVPIIHKGKLILVAPSAVAAHLGHGDRYATYTIAASAGEGGTLDPSGAVAVPYGESQTFTITPGDGYTIQDVVVDGASVGPVTSYTFADVEAEHTLEVIFAMPVTHTLTVTSLGPGTVSPSGVIAVPDGGSVTFTITAEPYMRPEIHVDGTPEVWLPSSPDGGVFTYTMTYVTEDHTVRVLFSPEF